MEQRFLTVRIKRAVEQPQRGKLPEQAAVIALAIASVVLACAASIVSLWALSGGAVGVSDPNPQAREGEPFSAAATLAAGDSLEETAVEATPYYPLTDQERDIVERVVFAESGNQSLEGQMAVALCILNTAQAEGLRPDEVVAEPNQYTAPVEPEEVSDRTRAAVSAVFDQGLRVTDEPIRYFYAPKYSRGEWHEGALEYVTTIGDHKFFKERKLSR